MVIDLSEFTASDYAAWWGAVVATVALIWNITQKLREGPRVKVRVTPNMRVYPAQPPTYDNDYISVKAVNVGTAPTTITHLAGWYTKNIIGLVRKSKRQHFVVNVNQETGNVTPFVLQPGTEWGNLTLQTDLLEKAGNGYVYLGVIHNQRERPVYKRVKGAKPDDA